MECPECGKRALSVATRCPHCGFHFPARPLDLPSRRSPFSRVVAGITAAAIVVAVAMAVIFMRRGPTKPEPARTVAPSDSVTVGQPNPAAAPASDTLVSRPTGPAAEPPSSHGVRRYARTWANVRGDRSRSAPAVGVLNPGDSVLVDSLLRGWYRVLEDGRTIGYVHRSTLAASPPP
jgi:hypothetical protein